MTHFHGIAAIGAVLCLLVSNHAAAAEKPPAASLFFPLDNGVGRGTWTPEQQAQTVKELGYDGIGYNYTTPEAAVEWHQQLHRRGLRLFSLYVYGLVDEPEATRYAPGLQEAIRQLKGTDTIIWMTLRIKDPKKKKDKSGYDDACVRMLNEVADWAKASGLRVAIYPHFGFYIATAEEALRIVTQVQRPDVGLTVNLCHELIGGNAQRLPEIVRLAAPHMFLASINGADNDGKPNGYIQRLDQGSYDVYGFLKLLKANGYRGPIGLQCYKVQGDIRENLEKSMGAWRGYVGRLANE